MRLMRWFVSGKEEIELQRKDIQKTTFAVFGHNQISFVSSDID